MSSCRATNAKPYTPVAAVGSAYLSAAINEGIRAGRTDDKPCKCGTIVCSYRGPCAPVAAKPAPAALPADAPKPAAERDPYEAAGHPWARVGMLVKYKPPRGSIYDAGEYRVTTPHRSAIAYLNSEVWLAHSGSRNGESFFTRTPHVEPIEPAAPGAESDEAVLARARS